MIGYLVHFVVSHVRLLTRKHFGPIAIHNLKKQTNLKRETIQTRLTDFTNVASALCLAAALFVFVVTFRRRLWESIETLTHYQSPWAANPGSPLISSKHYFAHTCE